MLYITAFFLKNGFHIILRSLNKSEQQYVENTEGLTICSHSKQNQNENTSFKYRMMLPDQEKGPYSLLKYIEDKIHSSI